MTIEASGGKASRFGRRSATRTVGLPIGEADANIFNCPACARPLGVGASRCPGCTTRLVAGIKATKAAGFVIFGLVAGLMVGGGTVAAVTAISRPATVAIIEAPPIVAPSQAVVPTGRPLPVDPGIPTAALSALRQSTVVNQRLLVDVERLTAALAATTPTGQDIAPILRGLAANAGFGDRLAPSIADWDDGVAVSQGLVTFYAALGGIARDGLAASLSNTRAYVDAGNRMMAVIDGMTDLDAASRILAASADLELPLLVPPTAP